MLDFPNTPVNGTLFQSGGVTWVWDGVKWTPGANGIYYLPLSGGTISGNLTVTGITTLATATAATVATADNSTHIATTAWVNAQGYASPTGFLPITGGTLSGPGNLTVNGLLTLSNASYAQISYSNTTAPIAAGGLWRTYVGTGGNYNIQTNTAAAGDFSTQIAHAFTATGALGINYAPPSNASGGHLFTSNTIVSLGGSMLFNNVYNTVSTGARMIATGAGAAFNMGSGGFQFYTTPSAAAGAAISGWTQIATIDSTGSLNITGWANTHGLSSYGAGVYSYYTGDPGQATDHGGFSATGFRFAVSSGDESNAGFINYRTVGGSDALNIIGAGPASTGVRLVRIYDQLQVEYSGANAMLVAGNTQVNGNFCCGGFLSTAVGQIVTMGGTAGFIFMDRSGSPQWQWYASGNIARLWNSGTGDRVTVDSNGALTNTGYMTAADFRSNGNVYVPSGYGYFSSYVQAGGNFYVGGSYIYQAGGGGTVNASGGPFIYADSNNTVLHVGSGNGNVYMQNSAGRQTGGFRSDGWLSSLDNRQVAYCDGNYNTFKNGNADGNGLYIGGSSDRTNYYRNTSHKFQASEAGGTGDFAHIDSNGVYSNNQVNSAQYMYSLTYVRADNTGTAIYAPNGNVVCQSLTQSDRRLKTNIADSSIGLDAILGLVPKTFNRLTRPDEEELGLIAQEVAEVLPHAVSTCELAPEDANMGIYYSVITTALIGAVKELAARLATLEKGHDA